MYSTPEELENALKRDVKIVSRKKWKAKEPIEREELTNLPVRYIVMMLTNTKACQTKKECIKVIQDLQEQHMAEGESDIRYNYLISIDGTVYEGRGPSTVPSAFPETDREFCKTNKKSINIACIDNGSAKGPEKIVEVASLLATQLFKDRIVDTTTELLWYMPKKQREKEEAKERKERYRPTWTEFNRTQQMKQMKKMQSKLQRVNTSIFDAKPFSIVKKYFCRIISGLCESCSMEHNELY